MRTRRQHLESTPSLMVGILTNSDDRVPSILESFGLQVSPWRYNQAVEHSRLNTTYDVDLVALSYDVGIEKPDKRFFDLTRQMVQKASGNKSFRCIHVGDELEKDYHGANAGGWTGVLVDRENKHDLTGGHCVRNLAEIHRYLDNT